MIVIPFLEVLCDDVLYLVQIIMGKPLPAINIRHTCYFVWKFTLTFADKL